MTDGNTIRSVAKAMELLQLLSDAGEAMTLTAISERAQERSVRPFDHHARL